MPLFIIISGYFSNKTIIYTFKKKIISLTEIYVVVQILYIISSIILQRKSYDFSVLYILNAAAWYLLSLITWRIILQSIPTKLLQSKYLLYLSLMICILSGYLPINNNEFSILRTFTFLPFFFYGYAIRNRLIQLDKKYPIGVYMCMLVIILGVIILIGNKDLSSILYGKFPYYNQIYNPIIMMLLRIIFISISFIMSISIITIARNIPYIHIIEFIGKNSLIFYIFHILFQRVFIIIIKHYDLPLNFIWMIIYTLSSIIFLFILSNISFFRKILNPFTNSFNIIDKIKT